MMVCQPMPPSEPLRVLISYARKERLQSDLSKEGFDAWLEAQRVAVGRRLEHKDQARNRHLPGDDCSFYKDSRAMEVTNCYMH